MSAHPLSDLLPIPKGVMKPNAYDVFGITFGLEDEEAIQSRIRSTIGNLKSQKKSADPKRWKAAARLATEAKQLLNDPAQREQLNEQLTSMAGTVGPTTAFLQEAESKLRENALAPSDPLRGLLPDADPLAKFDPAIDQGDTTTRSIPSDSTALDSSKDRGAFLLDDSETEGMLPVENLLPSNDASLLPQELLESISEEPKQMDLDSLTLPSLEEGESPIKIENEVAIKKPIRNRKRRSKTGLLIPAVFALCCFGVVGLALYFIINKPGVVVTMSDDGLAVNPAGQVPIQQDNAAPSNPTPPKTKPKADPIMGKLGPDSKEKPSENGNQNFSDPIPEDTQKTPETSSEQMSDEEMSNQPKDPNMSEGTEPAITNPTPPPDLTKPSVPPTEPKPETVTPEVLEKAEQTLSSAVQAIVTADWNKMNDIANSILEQEMSREQKQKATELFQIIDLAIFYRTAIIDSITNLNVGDDFEVTTDFRVIVVEKSPQGLTVRYNRKNQSYLIDELPWPLAHKLASFEVAGGNFSTAAKAVYQFIAPKTNEGMKAEAIDWITEIQSELDGTEKENISVTLQSLVKENQ